MKKLYCFLILSICKLNLNKFRLLLFFFSNIFYAQSDCKDAIVVCGNTGFQGLNAVGTGDLVEYNASDNSCFSKEINSIWLKLPIKTCGTLGFIITPEKKDIDVDFDFHVFGPSTSCNSLGKSIRCSTTNPEAALLRNNTTGMTGEQADTSEGPGPNGNGFVQWLTVQAGQTYFIAIDRFTGNSNFSIEWLGTATFNDPPNLNVPTVNALDLEELDLSGDENPIVNFDLTKNTPVMKGNQTYVTVSYHTSSNDAIINSNIIQNPAAFKNSTNPQTIYTRITNEKTDCYNWTSFNLKIRDKITIFSNIYEICDHSDTDPLDGKVQFDLKKVTTSILKNQNIKDLTFQYYLSKNDAKYDIDKLPNDFHNTIPFQQSIFIKVSNNQSSVLIQEINLIVNSLPKINNKVLVQCNSPINADGFAIFNLKEANVTLTDNNSENNNQGFYETFAEAQTKTNPILPPEKYTNKTLNQVVFARVENKYGCFKIAEVTLQISNNTIANQQPVAICDGNEDQDGFYQFDLNAEVTPQVMSGLPNGLTVNYFLSHTDALTETNPLPNIFKNTTAFNQTIYARAINGPDCYDIVPITLVVNTFDPTHFEDETEYLCSGDEITLSVATGFSSYLWNIGSTSNSIQVNTSGDYTVTVTNNNGCEKTKKYKIIPSAPATITEVVIKDFAANENSVLIEYTGSGNYEFSLDGLSFQDKPLFNSVSPGIYNAIARDKNGCGLSNSYQIIVLDYPRFFTPNGDSFNDVWSIKNLHQLPDYKISIFDRYGKLLKQMNQNSTGWTGLFNGQQLPADDYWFNLIFSDGRIVKGHFSLKR